MSSLFKLKASGRAEWADVDAQDYLELYRYTWHVDERGYFIRKLDRNRDQKLHRDVLGLDPGDERIVDHIDGVRSNNKRDNLRITTRAGNNQNVKSRGGTSRYRGVRKFNDDRDRPWQAYASQDGEKVHIGSYKTEEEAARAARNWRMENYELTNEDRSELDTADVYVLIDPRDGSIRYLGKSKDAIDRYRHHIKPSRRKLDTEKADWIQDLFDQDLAPCLFVIEEVTEDVWEEREEWWLDQLENEPLTNHQAGGEGQTRGRTRSERVREKLRRHPAGESQGGTSDFPGVSYNEEKEAWVGFITIRGKNHYVGQFDNELECARAVYEEREKHYDFEYEDSFEQWAERVNTGEPHTEGDG